MARMIPRLVHRLLLAGCMAFAATSALATAPVTLRDNPVDDDGQVTLGELFEGAGAASDIIIARRAGPTVVLDAGMVQARASQAGLTWANPRGLRRVVVRQGGATASASSGATSAAARPGETVEVLTWTRSLAAGDIIRPEDLAWTEVQAHRAPSGGPADAEEVIGLSARRALRSGTPVLGRDLAQPQVIARNDLVQVSYVDQGLTLTITGRATRDAAIGEPVAILNLQSGRTIDAVATAPGQAIVGPAARAFRSASR
jgi:flagellar basal body P-ring formation protein FlgA